MLFKEHCLEGAQALKSKEGNNSKQGCLCAALFLVSPFEGLYWSTLCLTSYFRWISFMGIAINKKHMSWMLLSAGEKCYCKSLTPADAGHPGKASLAQVITIFQASIWELQDCSPLIASLQTDCIQKSSTGKKDLNLSDIDVSAIHTCTEQLPKAACKTCNCEEMYPGLKCLGKMIIWDLYVLGVLTSVLQIVTGKHENLDKSPQNGHLCPACWPVTTRTYKHYSLLWNEQELRRDKLASISYLMCTIDLLFVQFNQNGISPECCESWLTCVIPSQQQCLLWKPGHSFQCHLHLTGFCNWK